MKPLYRVYVDETGDRGWGGRSSPIFVVSAVIVRDGAQKDLLAALDQLNTDLGKPPNTVLHWAENIKQHTQRKHVVRSLAALDMTITSVVVFKQPMMGCVSGWGCSYWALCSPRRAQEEAAWLLRQA